jgi:hypothetical protein
MNFRLDRGAHNVKLGGEMKILHQNHYETQTPTFTFSGGRYRAGSRRAERLQCLRDFLLAT